MEKANRRHIVFAVLVTLLVIATILVSLVAYALNDSDQTRAMAATVQVIAVINPPDYAAPWQCRPTESLSGSGVLLADGRVLTNAHVVTNAVSIELRRMGLPDRYLAHVEHIDHASDLALLHVEKAEFSVGAETMPLGDMPEMEATVNVYGYPLNAQTVCSTEGVVSRLEYDMYSHGFNNLLMAQLDATINPGNSGGPAVADGKIVGLAMQKPDDTEGAGQFIPAPVIRRFLADAADGRVDGVPSLSAGFQVLESEPLRVSLGMSATQTGVMVCDVAVAGSCGGALRSDDVVMAIDGHAVANDATVALPDNRRVDMAWLINARQVGNQVSLDVLRDGVTVRETITLKIGGLLLDGPHFPARAPYRIFGGLVFQPVDMNLAITNCKNLPTNILSIYERDLTQTLERRERVTLGRVLPHGVNRGYQEWGTELVETVQGVPVRDFDHFNEMLDAATGTWIAIGTDDGMRIVLDLAAARASLAEILHTFNIAAERYPSPATPPIAESGVTS